MDFAAHELPLERWRTYRLVKLTGWTLEQIGNASAVELDWLLQCEIAESNARDNATKRANKGS